MTVIPRSAHHSLGEVDNVASIHIPCGGRNGLRTRDLTILSTIHTPYYYLYSFRKYRTEAEGRQSAN